jgi:hypothetical protein
MTHLLILIRTVVRDYDAVYGPGAARVEAVAITLTLCLATICAIGLAAITGDA